MQTNAQGIEHISLITTPVILLKGDKVISQGTGFFYVLEDSTKKNIIFELSSLRSQLECWNVGIMGLGKWDIEIRTEFALDNEVNKRVSFLQYQHSNIPTFHYSMYEA